MMRHRRSARALILLLSLLVALAVFGLGIWVGRRSMRAEVTAEVMAQIKAARREVVDAAAQPATQNAGAPSAAARLAEFSATLRAAAEKLGAEERKPLLAAQQLVESVQPQMAEYEAALNALSEAGFVAPATFKTESDLGKREALVQRFKTANGALLGYFKNAEKNYRAALDRLGVADKMKEGALQGFRRGGNFDLNLTIHEANRELANAMLEIVKLLRRDWGRWKLSEQQEVVFDEEETVREFQALQAQLSAAAARQAAAEKELLGRANEKSSPAG